MVAHAYHPNIWKVEAGELLASSRPAGATPWDPLPKTWIFDPMYSLIHLISRWLEIFYIFFVCDAGMKPLTCFFLCPGGTKAWLDGPIMLDRGFATALHPSPQPWKFLRVVSIRAAASDSRRHQATTLAFKEASSECLRSSCINSALSL